MEFMCEKGVKYWVMGEYLKGVRELESDMRWGLLCWFECVEMMKFYDEVDMVEFCMMMFFLFFFYDDVDVDDDGDGNEDDDDDCVLVSYYVFIMFDWVWCCGDGGCDGGGGGGEGLEGWVMWFGCLWRLSWVLYCCCCRCCYCSCFVVVV